jgi:Uma2 family endonuclease
VHGQLDPAEWSLYGDFGLDVGPDTLRYPDITVDRAGGRRADRVASAPVILIEVLSPSAADIDLNDKAAEYVALPTLAAYLIFAQEPAECWAWIRGDAGFPSEPTLIAGLDKIVRLATPRLQLPLAAVYAGIPDE